MNIQIHNFVNLQKSEIIKEVKVEDRTKIWEVIKKIDNDLDKHCVSLRRSSAGEIINVNQNLAWSEFLQEDDVLVVMNWPENQKQKMVDARRGQVMVCFSVRDCSCGHHNEYGNEQNLMWFPIGTTVREIFEFLGENPEMIKISDQVDHEINIPMEQVAKWGDIYRITSCCS